MGLYDFAQGLQAIVADLELHGPKLGYIVVARRALGFRRFEVFNVQFNRVSHHYSFASVAINGVYDTINLV